MRNKTVSEQTTKSYYWTAQEVWKAEPVNETLGDVADRILGEFSKGIPASQYCSCQGRTCDIDIYSDGFDELPKDVQIKAYKIYNQKNEVVGICIKKIESPSSSKALKSKEINNIRYSIYEELG